MFEFDTAVVGAATLDNDLGKNFDRFIGGDTDAMEIWGDIGEGRCDWFEESR